MMNHVIHVDSVSLTGIGFRFKTSCNFDHKVIVVDFPDNVRFDISAAENR